MHTVHSVSVKCTP